MIRIPTLIEICTDCKTKVHHAMFEVLTERAVEDIVPNVHLTYCPRCDEFKGYKRNYPLSEELPAVIDAFETIYQRWLEQFGKVKGYKVRIPFTRNQ